MKRFGEMFDWLLFKAFGLAETRENDEHMDELYVDTGGFLKGQGWELARIVGDTDPAFYRQRIDFHRGGGFSVR